MIRISLLPEPTTWSLFSRSGLAARLRLEGDPDVFEYLLRLVKGMACCEDRWRPALRGGVITASVSTTAKSTSGCLTLFLVLGSVGVFGAVQ